MKTVAGNLATDELLKIKWLNVLPASARSILCVLGADSLDKLAEAADKLVDTMPATVLAAGLPNNARYPSLHRTTQSTAIDSFAADMAALHAGMTQLVSINRLMLDRAIITVNSARTRATVSNPAVSTQARLRETNPAASYSGELWQRNTQRESPARHRQKHWDEISGGFRIRRVPSGCPGPQLCSGSAPSRYNWQPPISHPFAPTATACSRLTWGSGEHSRGHL